MFTPHRTRPPTMLSAAAGAVLAALIAVPAGAASAAPAAPAAPAAAAGHGAAVSVAPDRLTFVVPAGQQRERTLTLSNAGSTATAWQVAEDGDGGSAPAAGEVLKTWTADVSQAWGIGVEGANIWISDADILRNDGFTVDGVRTGEGWPTTWAAMMPVDMAYVAASAMMCQVNVGGDNGLYCWNPRTGEIVASITGGFPWSAPTQRGLAYRPDDDTFYIGGTQGIIYHIRGFGHAEPGSVIGQCAPADPSVSGLGWYAALGVLWVATNSATDTMYAVDPDTCATLRTLAPPDQDAYTGGGLDVDAAGNLWMVSQSRFNPNVVYLVGSGTANPGDVPWLSVTPAAGTLAPRARQHLTVRVDTTGLEPGRYKATLTVTTGDTRPPVTVRVRLVVLGGNG